MFHYTASYTDLYQLSMAQVYFKTGRKHETAVFDYFFRKQPFDGGYTLFCGLQTALTVIEDLYFSRDDIRFLETNGFDPDFLDYLKDFRFNGHIYSTREGDLVFPTRPILQVEATLIEAQIIETLLLNILNYQTLIATKASRMKQVAGQAKLVDFGLRRAQSTAAYHGARAAIIGGFDATSNVKAAQDLNIPVSGTMAHSFVQSYDHEIDAFRDYAEHRPGDCVLLVDTYDTLNSGIPNAIQISKEMQAKGYQLLGIRLDSGDLAYLSRKAREMLDDADLASVKIAVSNQLDEKVIKSLKEQQAPIDLFGVGTSLMIGKLDAALDGVYKLAEHNGQPSIKLSESIEKVTIPGRKQVYRLSDHQGNWIGADIVALRSEGSFSTMHSPHDPLKSMNVKPFRTEALLKHVMKDGEQVKTPESVQEIAAYARDQLNRLEPEYKRFDNSHIYKVGLSGKLYELRHQLITKNKST
jgi:nicotinate phosphoribosyltransferase